MTLKTETLQISIMRYLHLEDDDVEDHSEARVDKVFRLLLDDLPSRELFFVIIEDLKVSGYFEVFYICVV